MNCGIFTYQVLVFALNICLAATIYKHSRSRTLGRLKYYTLQLRPSTSNHAQHPSRPLVSTSIPKDLWNVLAVKIISHPAFGVVSHSFNVPYYIHKSALNRVERLELKTISRPAFDVGSHALEVLYYLQEFTLNRVYHLAVMITSHPAFRAGNHSFSVPLPGICIYAEPCRSFSCTKNSHVAVGVGQHLFNVPYPCYTLVVPLKQVDHIACI